MNTQLLNQLFPQSNSPRPEFLMRSLLNQQSKADVGQTEAPDQGLELQPAAPKSSQQILNQQILSALNREIASTGAAPVQTLDAADFTPQKVADRIMGFINQAIGRANASDPTGETGKQMMEQARAGVEQGFAEARDILEGLDVLNGKVEEDIDQTYNLIQQGLGNRAAASSSDASAQVPANISQGGSLSAMSSSYSRSESTELTIQTRDGDNITIRLVNQNSASSSQFSAQGNGVSVQGFSSQSSQMSGYEIQVEGNLDEGERAAIQDLLGRADQLASDFFEGDVEEAFNQAMELGFDTEELSNFSLNLSYSEERAVSAYQQNSSLSGNEGSMGDAQQLSDLSQILQKASDFLKQFQQLLQDDTANRVFKNPGEAARDIFTEMVQSRKDERGERGDHRIEKQGHQLRDFLHSLMEQVKAQRVGEVGMAPTPTESEEQASEEAVETVGETPVAS